MSSTSLSSRVYDEILNRLISGRWRPGHVFNRRQLAAELSVSVAPVLEAMLELQSDGLIETAPRKGTRVRKMELADLQGRLILREAIECQAARLYCGEPIRRHMKRLLQLAERIDAGDIRSGRSLKQEVRFHHSLVSLAGVPALTEAYDRVMKVGLFFTVCLLHPDQDSAPRLSHVSLLRALSRANPDAAEAAVRAHAQSGKEAIFAQASPSAREKFPASPAWLRA